MHQQAQTFSLPSCFISSLSGQLAEIVSPCVETAPVSPTNSLYALSKSYQTWYAAFSQQWERTDTQMCNNYFSSLKCLHINAPLLCVSFSKGSLIIKWEELLPIKCSFRLHTCQRLHTMIEWLKISKHWRSTQVLQLMQNHHEEL